MLCNNPVLAYRDSNKRLLVLSADEKKQVIENVYIKPNFYRKDSTSPLWLKYPVLKFPCGKCLLCRASQRAEWTLRCWLEARQYESNHFITLTYNTENYPQGGVNKNELSRFIHNVRQHFLRKRNHVGIRFFGSGEYGKDSLRPHYHVLLFNCPPFGDEKEYGKNDFGQILYKSKILENLWGKGHCTIGALTRQSADYAARYALKFNYLKLPSNLNTAFISMSKRKGIGLDYLYENLNQIIADDGIIFPDGTKAKLPRFFDTKIKELIGEERFKSELAQPRAEKAKAFIAEEMALTGLTEEELSKRYVERMKEKIEKYHSEYNKNEQIPHD